MTDPVAIATPGGAASGTQGRTPPETEVLRHLAQEMEAAFLSEMLGHAGLGEASDSFGGGISEDQFGSFLREQQATAMVRAGGIGLSESLFHALAEGRNARS